MSMQNSAERLSEKKREGGEGRGGMEGGTRARQIAIMVQVPATVLN